MSTPLAPVIDGATHLHSGKVRDLYALAGVLVLIGWAVIPAAIGCLATIRRDVD